MEQIIVESFEKFDGGGSGKIACDELAEIFRRISPSSWDGNSVHKLMSAVDNQGKGYIEYSDFIAWILSSPKEPTPEEFDAMWEHDDFSIQPYADSMLDESTQLPMTPEQAHWMSSHTKELVKDAMKVMGKSQEQCPLQRLLSCQQGGPQDSGTRRASDLVTVLFDPEKWNHETIHQIDEAISSLEGQIDLTCKQLKLMLENVLDHFNEKRPLLRPLFYLGMAEIMQWRYNRKEPLTKHVPIERVHMMGPVTTARARARTDHQRDCAVAFFSDVYAKGGARTAWNLQTLLEKYGSDDAKAMLGTSPMYCFSMPEEDVDGKATSSYVLMEGSSQIAALNSALDVVRSEYSDFIAPLLEVIYLPFEGPKLAEKNINFFMSLKRRAHFPNLDIDGWTRQVSDSLCCALPGEEELVRKVPRYFGYIPNTERPDDCRFDDEQLGDVVDEDNAPPKDPRCNRAMEWSDYAGEGYEKGWSCNNFFYCGGNQTSQGAWRWFCKACESDLCSNCRANPDGPAGTPQCPDGHSLESFQSPAESCVCSGCKTTQYQDENGDLTMYSCRRCNYDLCKECFAVALRPNQRVRVTKSFPTGNVDGGIVKKGWKGKYERMENKWALVDFGAKAGYHWVMVQHLDKIVVVEQGTVEEEEAPKITVLPEIGSEVEVTTDSDLYELEWKSCAPIHADGTEKDTKLGLKGILTEVDPTRRICKLSDDLGWIPIRTLVGFTEWVAPDGPVCTAGHALVFQATECNGFKCANCCQYGPTLGMPSGTIMGFCRACDWEICPKCALDRSPDNLPKEVLERKPLAERQPEHSDENIQGSWRDVQRGLVLDIICPQEDSPHSYVRCFYGSVSAQMIPEMIDGEEWLVGDELHIDNSYDGLIRVRYDNDSMKVRYYIKEEKNWTPVAPLTRMSGHEIKSMGEYEDRSTIWEALREDNTILIKASWLLDWAKTGEPLPRRQDLPQGAAWDSYELQRLVERREVFLMAVSYCWTNTVHPDPEAYQLNTLAKILGHRLQLRYHDAQQVYSDAGIFLDYCSLCQNATTKEEMESFKAGLQHCSLWYAHCEIESWLMTSAPEGCPRYHERGWPTFEKALSSLITPHQMLYDLGQYDEHKHTAWDYVYYGCRGDRNPPKHPDRMDKELAELQFTNGADLALVQSKYRSTFEKVMANVEHLFFDSLEWGCSEAKEFAECLHQAKNVKVLTLKYNKIGIEGTEAVCEQMVRCPLLENVSLSGNAEFGCAGAEAFAKALPKMNALKIVNLRENNIGDRGCKAMMEAIPCSGPSLRDFFVFDNKIGDEGAKSIIDKLPDCRYLKTFGTGGNNFSDEVNDTIARAWEADPNRDPARLHLV
jgi:hypothetical protein